VYSASGYLLESPKLNKTSHARVDSWFFQLGLLAFLLVDARVGRTLPAGHTEGWVINSITQPDDWRSPLNRLRIFEMFYVHHATI
jgi:hypothetical protein